MFFDSAPSYISTVISSTQINLAWTDNSTGETGFKVERKLYTGVWNLIATIGPNITSYENTGLTASTQYFYRVYAYTTGGNSDYSNEIDTNTQRPSDPNSLTATVVGSNQIDLAWQDNANNETGFKIERKTGAAGTYAVIATVGPNSVNYNNTGLNPSTLYYYRVYAYNVLGNSNYASVANTTAP